MSGRIRAGWLLMIAVVAGCQAELDSARGSHKGTALRRAPQLHNAVVGRRNADGTITTTCLDDAGSVAAFLHGPAPAETRIAQ